MDVKRCLDTYALMEITEGNKKFIEIINSNFVITDITLAEFYSVLLRKMGEQTADYWLGKFERHSLSVGRDILIKAVKFRHEYKKTNISFFDAVGYIFSIEHGFYFVTGDKEFEKMINVGFKKK